MKDFVDFHSLKWGSAVWLTIYLCCLLLLWYKRKEWKEGYDLFFWLTVGAMLVAYCPLTYKLLVPGFLLGFGGYERLGYVFFVIPVIAFTVTALARGQRSRAKRALFLAACAVLLLTIGRVNNWQWFNKPQNPYKIPQEAIETSEMIREDTGDEYVKVSVQLTQDLRRKSDQYDDYLLYYGIRQYESNLYLLSCIVPRKLYDDPALTLDGMLNLKTDYYVGPKGIDSVERELDRLHYVQIGETEHYRVFRNQMRYKWRKEAKEETP